MIKILDTLPAIPTTTGPPKQICWEGEAKFLFCFSQLVLSYYIIATPSQPINRRDTLFTPMLQILFQSKYITEVPKEIHWKYQKKISKQKLGPGNSAT